MTHFLLRLAGNVLAGLIYPLIVPTSLFSRREKVMKSSFDTDTAPSANVLLSYTRNLRSAHTSFLQYYPILPCAARDIVSR